MNTRWARRNQNLYLRLESSWTLWYLKFRKEDSWLERLQDVATFSTVDDCSLLFEHIMPASQLGYGCDYLLFKEGIFPAWEGEANVAGGRWVMTFKGNMNPAVLDQIWMQLVWSVVTGILSGQLLNGVTVNVRRNCVKIALWTKDWRIDQRKLIQIGLQFKSIVGASPTNVIQYHVHSEGRKANAKFYL